MAPARGGRAAGHNERREAVPVLRRVIGLTPQDGPSVAEAARRADAIGLYTGLVFPDHLILHFGFVPVLTWVARAASGDRLRDSCRSWLNNDLRHPAILAQDLASLDVLRRAAAWTSRSARAGNKPEYDALGLPFDARRRPPVARLTEAVAVLKGAFGDGPFSFAGEHYTITNLDGQPKPVQRPHPPLLIGGGGKRVLTLAGREADIVGLAPRTLTAPSGEAIRGDPTLESRSPPRRRSSAGSGRRPATGSDQPRGDRTSTGVAGRGTLTEQARRKVAADVLRTGSRSEDRGRAGCGRVPRRRRRCSSARWTGSRRSWSSCASAWGISSYMVGDPGHPGAGRGTAGGHLTMGIELGVYMFGEVTISS